MSDPRSDLELLEAWRGGDSGAGQALLTRHVRRLYLFFSNKIGEDVSDLVQRTMLGVVEGRDRLRDDAAFRPYLLRVARNQLYLHYRERMQAQGVTASEASVADLGPGPQTRLGRRAEQRRLLAALRRVPLELQIVIELVYWEELSMGQLAEVLEVPLGTAKSRLRRAREALAAQLDADEGQSLSGRTSLDDIERWARSIRAELDARV